MAKIKFRRDTTANWATANSVLSQGEPGLDITTNSLKVGDGITAWANLDYIANRVYPTPEIEYTGVFGSIPPYWRYTASPSIYISSSNSDFRTNSSNFYWLDEHFDDENYDLSGLTTINFKNIGGVKGYFDISSKTEVLLTSFNLGDIAVVDEWYSLGGFSNTLTTCNVSSLIDVGGTFEIYGNEFNNGPRMDYTNLDRVTGTFTIDYNQYSFANTVAPTFPALTHAQNGMNIHNNKYTSWTDFSSLHTLTGNFQFYNNSNNDAELYDGPGLPVCTRIQSGSLSYYNNSYMQSISEFADLARIDYTLNMYDNSDLASFPSFPVLEYIGGAIVAYDNPYMTTLDTAFLPSILRIDGNVEFGGCGLNQTSVDAILVKLASLNGTNGTTSYDSRTINLNTGTNSIPSGTGLAAKAVLELRNCVVNVNS